MATSRSRGRRLVTIRSPNAMSPLVTASRPASSRSVVVLPQPVGPTKHQELAIANRKAGVGDGHLLAEALDQITGDDRSHLDRS